MFMSVLGARSCLLLKKNKKLHIRFYVKLFYSSYFFIKNTFIYMNLPG